MLTVLIGILVALVGTVIAQRTGVPTTNGVDWIELVFQVGLAVIGVAAVAAWRRNRGHTR